MKLVAIVGTNADFSYNRKLLYYMKARYQDQVEIDIVETKDIPLFNRPSDRQLPATIQAMEAKIKEADGVIFSTPEYDHSIPSSLSATIEWLSFGEGVLNCKPSLIVGAAYGALGSSRAQQNMRDILQSPEVRAIHMASQEYLLGDCSNCFDENNQLINEPKVKELDQLMQEFIQFAKLYNETFAKMAAGEEI